MERGAQQHKTNMYCTLPFVLFIEVHDSFVFSLCVYMTFKKERFVFVVVLTASPHSIVKGE
jgi:anthranilate/para-aminobenzoate synthase component II